MTTKRFTYDTIRGKRMRRPYRPNAKEAAAWETDPEPDSGEDGEDETQSDKQEEEKTSASGMEENPEMEEDSNPLMVKALLDNIEKITMNMESDICPELKGCHYERSLPSSRVE